MSTRSKTKAAGGKAGGRKKQKQQLDELEPLPYIASLFELPPHGQAEQLLEATIEGKTDGFGLIEVEQQCEMTHEGLPIAASLVPSRSSALPRRSK